MSRWTDVFLAASILENVSSEDEPARFPAIEFINEWLEQNPRYGPLFVVEPKDETVLRPSACFVAACNHLDVDGFVDRVRAAPWQWRDLVQLFLRTEDDKGFQQVGLWTIVNEP